MEVKVKKILSVEKNVIGAILEVGGVYKKEDLFEAISHSEFLLIRRIDGDLDIIGLRDPEQPEFLKMTNRQLREWAAEAGIKVDGVAQRSELIAQLEAGRGKVS
jgi:hypothetical protein